MRRSLDGGVGEFYCYAVQIGFCSGRGYMVCGIPFMMVWEWEHMVRIWLWRLGEYDVHGVYRFFTFSLRVGIDWQGIGCRIT
jgi:hypothetical protein